MKCRRSAAIGLALGIGACAQAPVPDMAPGEEPAIGTDEAGLWQAVDRDEYRLQTSSAVIRDPDLQGYLETVLCRVAPDNCNDVRLYVLPDRNFNAYMAPNGMMIVYTGLLIRLANEAQLAAILGHEVAHYRKRHSLQRFRDMRSKNNILRTAGAVLSASVGIATASGNAAASAGRYSRAVSQYDTARMIAQTGSSVLQAMEIHAFLSVLEYSREQESESDQLGALWMAAAGYPAAAIAAIWAHMLKEEAQRKRSLPAYLRMHPTSVQRQKAAELLAAGIDKDDRAGQDRRAAYLARIAPFRNKWLHQARLGTPFELERLLIERQREIGVAPGLLALHEAGMYRRRNDAGDADRALSSLQTAVRNDGHPPETYRELGIALSDAGRVEEAKSAFQKYLTLAPEAVDRAMVIGYLEGTASE